MLGEVLTAAVTPFNPDGSVNYEAFKRLCTHLIDTGSDGVVVAGTTGESPTLTDDERFGLFEAAVESIGDRHDYGFGCLAPGTLIEMGDHSQRAVQDVKSGDMVWEPLLRKPVMVEKRVVGDEALPLVEIKVGTTSVRATTEHPMHTRSGVKQAIEVVVGDELLLESIR